MNALILTDKPSRSQALKTQRAFERANATATIQVVPEDYLDNLTFTRFPVIILDCAPPGVPTMWETHNPALIKAATKGHTP